MKKTASMIALALAVGFGLFVATVYAGETMGKSEYQAYEANTMLGSVVRSPQGEYIGRISDFVFDSDGHVTFAILAHGGVWRFGGKQIAIPYKAFSYDSKDRYFVLDVTRERLEAAPSFDRKALGDRKWAEDVYRYFGQQPYWTEEWGTEY